MTQPGQPALLYSSLISWPVGLKRNPNLVISVIWSNYTGVLPLSVKKSGIYRQSEKVRVTNKLHMVTVPSKGLGEIVFTL